MGLCIRNSLDSSRHILLSKGQPLSRRNPSNLGSSHRILHHNPLPRPTHGSYNNPRHLLSHSMGSPFRSNRHNPPPCLGSKRKQVVTIILNLL